MTANRSLPPQKKPMPFSSAFCMAASEEAVSGEGWNLTVRTGYDGAVRVEFLLGANDAGTSIVQVEIDPADFSKLLDIMVRYPGTGGPIESGPSASGAEMLAKAIAKHGKRERKARAALDDVEGESE
jgi:hypothetical protein